MRQLVAGTMAVAAILSTALADAVDSGDEFTVRKVVKVIEKTETEMKINESDVKPKKPPRKCWKCHGKGKLVKTVRETCDRCEGAGVLITEVTLRNKHWGDAYGSWGTTNKKSTNKRGCPRCNRTGSIPVKKEVECSSCKGKGTL